MSKRDTLATDFVLGELEPADQVEAQRLMREDADFAASVARLRPLVGHLGELPAGAWPPEPERASARSRRTRRAILATAAAALLLAGIAVGWLARGGGAGPAGGNGPGPAVVLRPVGSAPADASARAAMRAGGRMVIDVSRLPDPGPGGFYEVWLLNSPRDLVTVASFRPGARGQAHLTATLPVSPRGFRYLDVSLQRAGAGPAHSGDSVLRGRLPV